jgi:hypothetical protein
VRSSIKQWVLIAAAALAACAAWAQTENETRAIAELFKPGRAEYASLFDESFLKLVPEEKIREIVQLYVSNVGAYKSAVGGPGSYELLFEKGKVPCKISIASPGRITGLWFGNWILFDDTPDKLRAAFSGMEGEVSVCVTKNGTPVFQVSADNPMAVGSAFKLYILRALEQKISRGKAGWEDTVRLRAEWMSTGGGILQNWPVGSPVTLHTLASLMISISDNTATDQLLHTLGRGEVEAVAPTRMRPFLSTLEMIKLKWTAGGAQGRAYAAAAQDKKREILSRLESIPMKDIASSSAPMLVKEVEWLVTTSELCRVAAELKDLPVLSINPGLVDKATWSLVAFKGGSEPGVLNYTHVLRKTAGSSVYAVSATINNTIKEVDTSAFTELVSRLIGLIERNGF